MVINHRLILVLILLLFIFFLFFSPVGAAIESWQDKILKKGEALVWGAKSEFFTAGKNADDLGYKNRKILNKRSDNIL